MAGVVGNWQGQIFTKRLIRDDVLESLYGKSSAAPINLINTALSIYQTILESVPDLAQLDRVMGMVPGAVRQTEAESISETYRQAALLYSSLSMLDKLDDTEDADIFPSPEETGKRFSTEVKDLVLGRRVDWTNYFNRAANILENGEPVRFGFLSDRAILHFSVLHPVRQSASVRDARAKLWELARGRDYSGLPVAELIMAVPRDDEPTLGPKQLDSAKRNRDEIEREADSVEMKLTPVMSAQEAADRVIRIASVN